MINNLISEFPSLTSLFVQILTLGQRGQKTIPCPVGRSRIAQIREFPPTPSPPGYEVINNLISEFLSLTSLFVQILTLGQRGQKTIPCPVGRSRIAQIREFPPTPSPPGYEVINNLISEFLSLTSLFVQILNYASKSF